MGKKTGRKLLIKSETLRQLDALGEEQLRRIVGGTIELNTVTGPGDLTVILRTQFCAGVRTGTGPSVPPPNTFLRCTTE